MGLLLRLGVSSVMLASDFACLVEFPYLFSWPIFDYLISFKIGPYKVLIRLLPGPYKRLQEGLKGWGARGG